MSLPHSVSAIVVREMFQGMLTLMEQQKEMIMELRSNHQTNPLKIVGVKMPTYFGHLNESLESFFFRVRKYCLAQGIDMDAPENQDRVIAFIALNLRGAAAVWYQQVVLQGVFYQINVNNYALEKDDNDDEDERSVEIITINNAENMSKSHELILKQWYRQWYKSGHID